MIPQPTTSRKFNPLGIGPSDPDDDGQVTVGYYTLADGLLTMMDGAGSPCVGA
jgi:hypothetical protein